MVSRRILVTDPAERPSANELLKSPFITKHIVRYTHYAFTLVCSKYLTSSTSQFKHIGNTVLQCALVRYTGASDCARRERVPR